MKISLVIRCPEMAVLSIENFLFYSALLHFIYPMFFVRSSARQQYSTCRTLWKLIPAAKEFIETTREWGIGVQRTVVRTHCFSYGVPYWRNIADMEATRATMTQLDPNMAPDDRKRRLQRIPRPSGHKVSKAMCWRKLA